MGGRGGAGGGRGLWWAGPEVRADADPRLGHSQSVREAKAASHVLQTVWSFKELRSALQKDGWSKARFQVRPARPFLSLRQAGYPAAAPRPMPSGVFPRRSQLLLMPGAPRQPRVRKPWTTARCLWWKRAWVSMGPGPILRFTCAPPPGTGLEEGGPSSRKMAPTLLAPPPPGAFTLAPSWGRLCQGTDVGDRVPTG